MNFISAWHASFLDPQAICADKRDEILDLIEVACPDKRALLQALRTVKYSFLDDNAFDNRLGLQCVSFYEHEPPPGPGVIAIRDKFFAPHVPSNFLLADIIGHEGEHRVDLTRCADSLVTAAALESKRPAPNVWADRIERPAYLKSSLTALRVAAHLTRQRHHGRLVPLQDTPEGKYWVQYAPHVAPMLATFDRVYRETGDERKARLGALRELSTCFNTQLVPSITARRTLRLSVVRRELGLT